MSFLKTNFRFLLIIFLVFSNFWIYKIFAGNLIIGFCVSLLSLIIALKPAKKIIIFSILILAFLQFQTTSIKSLTLLDNDQQRIQSERLRAYPPTYIDLGLKVIWLKPAHWIEENKIIIATSRIEENLFTNLDINKFFFGGFPRNNSSDFEKFPFIYLPLFILGIYSGVKSKQFFKMLFLLILPLGLLAYIGSDNKLDPFILFPFFILSFLNGIDFINTKIKTQRFFYPLLILIITLVFILQISYAKL